MPASARTLRTTTWKKDRKITWLILITGADAHIGPFHLDTIGPMWASAPTKDLHYFRKEIET